MHPLRRVINGTELPSILVPAIAEPHGPPPPKRTRRVPKIEYPFATFVVGCSYRIPRAARTVGDRLQEWSKTPDGQGKKFIVRPVAPGICRVWRIK